MDIAYNIGKYANWLESKIVDYRLLTPPVKVDEGKALLDLIDKARTYNDGWIFTEEELIAGYTASQNQSSNK